MSKKKNKEQASQVLKNVVLGENSNGKFTITPKNGEPIVVTKATLIGCSQSADGVMRAKVVKVGIAEDIPSDYSRITHIAKVDSHWLIDDINLDKHPPTIPFATISSTEFKGAWKAKQFSRI